MASAENHPVIQETSADAEITLINNGSRSPTKRKVEEDSSPSKAKVIKKDVQVEVIQEDGEGEKSKTNIEDEQIKGDAEDEATKKKTEGEVITKDPEDEVDTEASTEGEESNPLADSGKVVAEEAEKKSDTGEIAPIEAESGTVCEDAK